MQISTRQRLAIAGQPLVASRSASGCTIYEGSRNLAIWRGNQALAAHIGFRVLKVSFGQDLDVYRPVCFWIVAAGK
ncbi:MAG TPA: hypothetical protein GX529_07230 [Firmicutes bacterium]|nr:hypothetical protein [Candidatus Fermentithermobacillaceae bacterium]